METTSFNPTNNPFILDAPLQVLHNASTEWLRDIEFWKDEVAFFYTLLRRKAQLDKAALRTEEAKQVEKHLIHVSVNSLDALQRDTLSHERFLARILEKPELDENLYRDQHHKLAARINAFAEEFRTMKKKIFEISKDEAFHQD